MSDDTVTRLHVGASTCLTHADSSFSHSADSVGHYGLSCMFSKASRHHMVNNIIPPWPCLTHPAHYNRPNCTGLMVRRRQLQF